MLYYLCKLIIIFAFTQSLIAQSLDGLNRSTGKINQAEVSDFSKSALFKKNAPRPKASSPLDTSLPLNFKREMSIAYVGNTLLDRSQDFGYLETLLHQAYPDYRLTFRNFSWSADTIDLQPRPANFADT